MAEFLIRVIDKGAAIDCSKRGDLISACPDGWAWSSAERTNPDWRIVKVSGILQTTIDTLLSMPLDPELDKRRRTWSIDFSKLPNPTLFTGARTQEFITLTKQQVTAAVVKKA